LIEGFSVKGIYILAISIRKNLKLSVGALGKIKFEKGTYVYVGSAQNNLEKRIERHLKKDKPKFWHIDYLLSNVHVKVLKIYCKEIGKTEECQIAKKISTYSLPIKGFVASDCKCQSHLFKIEKLEFLNKTTQEMQQYLLGKNTLD